jgi:hypothetical protein
VIRKKLNKILNRINLLDDWSLSRPLAQIEWEERYNLEMNFQQILTDEEMKWQRRGGEKWILQGDSNSSYFHKCANGRRRKMLINMLEIDVVEVTDQKALSDHISDYYKQLFGKAEVANIHLDTDFWPEQQQLQQSDNEIRLKLMLL